MSISLELPEKRKDVWFKESIMSVGLRIDASSSVQTSGMEEVFQGTCTEKATASYQNPGENSGLKRMKEEGAMVQAASPEFRRLQIKEAIEAKLRELSPLITLEKDALRVRDINTIIVQLVAPYNVDLAVCHADKLMGEDRAKAYVQISQSLPAEEAQELLNRLKKANVPIWSELVIICREELRRGLKEGQETLGQIIRHPSPELVELLIDYHLDGVNEALQAVHQEQIVYQRRGSPHTKQYGLLRLLKVEIKAESPLAFETLKVLRENTYKIRSEYLNGNDEEPEFAAEQFLDAWMNILKSEGSSLFLASEFNKDLAFILKKTKKFKEKYPDYIDDFELSLRVEIGKLVPHYSPQALTLIETFEDDYQKFRAIVDLIKAGYPKKEELFNKLQPLIDEEELSSGGLVNVYTNLFHCSALIHGVDQALPFLEKAKSILSEADEEDIRLGDVLSHILKAEGAFNLPSWKETLAQMREVIRDQEDSFSPAISTIVQAELEQVISSNA